MNCATHLVSTASKHEHISPLLADCTGFVCLTESITRLLLSATMLCVSQRIEYKIATVCCNVISGSAAPYLADLLQLYVPSNSLCSSVVSRIFHVPIRCEKLRRQHAFPYTGPVIWNGLPFSVCHVQSLLSFKSQELSLK